MRDGFRTGVHVRFFKFRATGAWGHLVIYVKNWILILVRLFSSVSIGLPPFSLPFVLRPVACDARESALQILRLPDAGYVAVRLRPLTTGSVASSSSEKTAPVVCGRRNCRRTGPSIIKEIDLAGKSWRVPNTGTTGSPNYPSILVVSLISRSRVIAWGI